MEYTTIRLTAVKVQYALPSTCNAATSGPEVLKLFFMLNSFENEFFSAYKNKKSKLNILNAQQYSA